MFICGNINHRMSAMDHLGFVVVALLVLSIHTSQGCDGENEEMALMPTPERTCDNYESSSPGGSKSGCVCSQGTVRHPSGTCVQPSECKARCGINEALRYCGRLCENQCVRGSIVPTRCIYFCQQPQPQCGCRDGFARNRNGVCMDRCQPTCRPDEEYLNCGSACPKTCQNYNENQLCTAQCVPGCFCRAGTVRAADGSCVTPDRCPSAGCGRNEELRYCGQLCENKCVNGAIAAVPCKHLCKQRECGCKDGFVRNAQGVCTNSCLSTRCQLNEELRICGKSCEDECVNGVIKAQPCGIMCPAEKSCGCKPGFARNDKGFCVNYCPNTKCGINEQPRYCGRLCENKCENGRIVAAPCAYFCVQPHPQCGCKDGFARNDAGVCMDTCSASDCPPNEYLKPCGRVCEDTCSNYNATRACPETCSVTPECNCLSGYVRNSDGNCVLPADCNTKGSICPANEHLKICGRSCEKTCDQPIIEACSYACVAEPTCSCDDGYVRSPKGNCVLLSDCPANNVCPRNEYLKQCGRVCEKTCREPNPQVCPLYCTEKPECSCRDGFYRNRDGRCVRLDQCRPETCGANQTYTDCGSSCPRTCSPVNDSQIMCPAVCVPGCFCGPEYVSSSLGCILPEDCPVAETCGYDEDYTECGTACPRTCANRNSKISCIDVCVEGCFCKPGLVRNEEGRCVEPSQCPPECPVNEEYNNCGRVCEQSCRDPEPKACGDVCEPAECACRPRYFRSDNGTCVEPEECPADSCPRNEYLKPCGRICEKTCENPNPKICPRICPPTACSCKEGYVRDTNTNRCIPLRRCPKLCKSDEEYQSCGTACPKTCKNYNQNVPCTLQCVEGCFCKKGTVRADDGSCVVPEKCPPVCRADEEYLSCGTACPKTCKNYNQDDVPCTLQCVEGCFCKEGTVRAEDGSCVVPEKCPPVSCGCDEEYVECGSACQINCDNYQYQVRFCLLPCTSGCQCKAGYVRDTISGACIPIQECPPKCPIHETYKRCDPHSTDCIPGCICRDGHTRNESGTCIPVDCGLYEEYLVTAPAHSDSCAEYWSNNRTRDAALGSRCVCSSGYARDVSNGCIPVDQCPERCPSGEVFMQCGASCVQTCDDAGNPETACTASCIPGCFCTAGLVRDAVSGKCILPEKCLPKCKPNQNTTECACPDAAREEFRTCGPACPVTCENYLDKYRLCTLECVAGCFCRQGLVRYRTGKCMRVQECEDDEPTDCDCDSGSVRNPAGFCVRRIHLNSVCGLNEEFQNCQPTFDRTCGDYDQAALHCTSGCVTGCFCREGYVRNSFNTCIAIEQCTAACAAEEMYMNCGPRIPDTCETVGRPEIALDTMECRAGCFCRPGLVRDVRNGSGCVLPEDCPRICGENEEYRSCGTACPASCENWENPGPCTKQCVLGCFCVDGFVRDQNGTCVSISQCPKICPKNEKYTTCGSSCPDTCDNLGTYRKCTAECVIGCVCEEGFVRNKDGCCVNPRECPDKGLCSTNEEYQTCSKKSQLSCSNYTQTPPPCSDECFHGCVCKEGYVRDVNGGCIDPSNCPPQPRCGSNEQFILHPSYFCSLVCSGTALFPYCQTMCVGGCVCLPGFIRDSSGVCSPPCPVKECTKANEEYQECGTACPKTCENYTNGTVCAEYCVPGCFCKSGYVRNKVGNCVKPNDCPNLCPNEHEHYACGSACDNECATLGEPCPIINVRCNDKCYCDKGYARDSCGTCIPECMCPPKE